MAFKMILKDRYYTIECDSDFITVKISIGGKDDGKIIERGT